MALLFSSLGMRKILKSRGSELQTVDEITKNIWERNLWVGFEFRADAVEYTEISASAKKIQTNVSCGVPIKEFQKEISGA